MTVDEDLDRLSRQLNRQSLGSIETVADEMVRRLAFTANSLVTSLRQTAYDQPLITLLLACQIGYLVGRVGRRYARRYPGKDSC
jgi:hypothetical protein